MGRTLRITAVLALLAFRALPSPAQTDIFAGYDFGSDRKSVTATLSGFYNDRCGDTYFRASYGFRPDPFSLNRGSLEIRRDLNFWRGVQYSPFWDFMRRLNIAVGFDGHLNLDNCNFLAGLDFDILSGEQTLKAGVYYKTFNGGAASSIPVYAELFWVFRDIFFLNGLTFRGSAEAWGEDISYWYGSDDPFESGKARFAALIRPQLWYSFGFLNLPSLSIGGEVEMGINYLGVKGFRCRPRAALRWEF